MSKKISKEEKIEIYENFFQRLHFLRHVAMDDQKVAKMLHIADNLVNNQTRMNAFGQPLDKKQVDANMKTALEAMKVLP